MCKQRDPIKGPTPGEVETISQTPDKTALEYLIWVRLVITL